MKRIAALFLCLCLIACAGGAGAETGLYLKDKDHNTPELIWTPSAVPSDYITPTVRPTEEPPEMYLFAKIPFSIPADEVIKTAKEKAQMDLRMNEWGDLVLSNQTVKINGYDADVCFKMSKYGLSCVKIKYEPFIISNAADLQKGVLNQFCDIQSILNEKYGYMQRGKMFVLHDTTLFFCYPFVEDTMNTDLNLVEEAILNNTGLSLECKWRNITLTMTTSKTEEGLEARNYLEYSYNGFDYIDYGEASSLLNYKEYLADKVMDCQSMGNAA